MIRRLAALVLALMLPLCASAAPAWPDQTAGQVRLREYINRVNMNLQSLGQAPVDALYECYPSFASLGVSNPADASIPGSVEMTFALYDSCLNTLQLRVSDASLFSAVAGSCIQAASPTSTTLESAMTDPARYAQRVMKEPGNSFEDAVDPLNGPAPRMYYAYYPDQYSDGVSWLQMTLIFPRGGVTEASASATETPPPSLSGYYDDNSETGFERYDYDGLTHFEIFTTATPEPDSAAMD